MRVSVRGVIWGMVIGLLASTTGFSDEKVATTTIDQTKQAAYQTLSGSLLNETLTQIEKVVTDQAGNPEAEHSALDIYFQSLLNQNFSQFESKTLTSASRLSQERHLTTEEISMLRKFVSLVRSQVRIPGFSLNHPRVLAWETLILQKWAELTPFFQWNAYPEVMPHVRQNMDIILGWMGTAVAGTLQIPAEDSADLIRFQQNQNIIAQQYTQLAMVVQISGLSLDIQNAGLDVSPLKDTIEDLTNGRTLRGLQTLEEMFTKIAEEAHMPIELSKSEAMRWLRVRSMLQGMKQLEYLSSIPEYPSWQNRFANLPSDSTKWAKELDKLAGEIQKGIAPRMPASEASLDALIATAPSFGRTALVAYFEEMRRAIRNSKFQVETTRGNVDKASEWLKKKNYLQALDELAATMNGLITKVRETDNLSVLRGVAHARYQIKNLWGMCVDSASERSNLAIKYARLLEEAVDQFDSLGTSPFLSAEQASDLNKLLQKTNQQQIDNIYYGRQMMTVYALSAVLVAEALAIPFSGGSVAMAMPATVQWFLFGAATAGNATLIATSGLDISDRFDAHGVESLLSMDSMMDYMRILSMIPMVPRVRTGNLSWKATPWALARNGWGQLAQASNSILAASILVRSTMDYLNAEALAEDAKSRGTFTTAEQIRARALTDIAWGIFAGARNRLSHAKFMARKGVKGLQYKQAYVEYRQNRRERWKYYVPLWKPFAGVRRDWRAGAYKMLLPNFTGNLLNNTASIGGGLITLGSGLLLGMTTFDYSYENAVYDQTPLPELRPGEIAATFVGFSPLDPLYPAARSLYAHQERRQKYGNRYFVVDFDSREDLLAHIAELGKKGKLRYIRVMSHGRPGKLKTQQVDVNAYKIDEKGEMGSTDTFSEAYENVDGWINAQWLTEKRDDILRVTRNAVAPDALFLYYSCLSGANYVWDKTGDALMASTADVFLPNGGDAYASTRVLVGIDAALGGYVYSNSVNEISRRDKAPPGSTASLQRPQRGNPTTTPVFPTLPVLAGEAPYTGNENMKLDVGGMVEFSFERLQHVVPNLPHILHYYSLQVDDSAVKWGNRVKHVKAYPH